VSAPAIAPAPDPTLLAAALGDLREDFDELLFLCRSGEAELAEAAADIAGADLHPGTRELLLGQLSSSRLRHRSTARRLVSLRDPGRRAAVAAPALLEELAGEKASLADLLRTERALTAALVGAADWQSPSFLHSTVPAAGRQDGRIREGWNDYKRDRHLDADACERRYREAMVDGPPGLRALLTSCGMAAFTTILGFLAMEGRLAGPVLAGAGLYHESRLLLERAVPGRLHVVDEGDPAALGRAIDGLRPSAVFLDTLSNTRWMPVPDLPPVMARLGDAYLVLDNTGLSASFQPFALADAVRLIVFESLLKYAQLGLDRANAGVIVARAEDAEALSGYREHLGTNVADVAVHALPRPDRRVLERRLARIQRNALILSRRLSERAPPSVAVVYPGLPSHRCAGAARALRFRGGFLSLVFREGGARLRRERALVERAVAEARQRGVPLVAGAGFGFDTTRVYVAATRPGAGEPFVRVAAGTEHRLQVEAVAGALASVLAG